MYEQRLSIVNVGDNIPDLELIAYNPRGEDIIKLTTQSFRGRWLVLVFYPADFSFICPTELHELSELYEEFLVQSAEILSISTDSVFSHKAWHDKSEIVKKVQFPMVSDAAGRLASYFGVYDEKQGTALRATFVIDPDGVIVTSEVSNSSVGRSARETLRKLRALKFVREHPGDVCPASWEPGQEVLHPGIKIIGEK